MKKVYVVEEYCVGCGLCKVNCLVEHSESKNVVKAYKFEDPKPVARIRIEENKPVSFSVSCRHCDVPQCVAACIAGAMQKDENGVVCQDESKCVGCLSCVMVCEFGGVSVDKERHKVVKCDLCNGKDIPACVTGCPNDALVVLEVDDDESENIEPAAVSGVSEKK